MTFTDIVIGILVLMFFVLMGSLCLDTYHSGQQYTKGYYDGYNEHNMTKFHAAYDLAMYSPNTGILGYAGGYVAGVAKYNENEEAKILINDK